MPSDLIGRSNEWDYSHRFCPTPHLDTTGLRRLSDLGATIGSHGGSHCDLTSCSPDKLRNELIESRQRLQDITGQPIECISYPFGRCNRRVTEAAGEAGYRRGFTMNFPSRTDDPLACGRYPVYGFDTHWSIRQKLDHGPAYQIERFKTAAIGRLSGGTVLLNYLRRRP
jgi:peptidoglycan/xylan/chitin deacetylase (PgdA/CDA1 family)